MNIKEMSLEKVTVPGTWKVWMEVEGELVCVGIFNHYEDAHAFKNGCLSVNDDCLVTRHTTVSMTVDDE